MNSTDAGHVVITRNINWHLPDYVRHAIDSPFVQDRLAVLKGLAHLHRVGNDVVQAEVINQIRRLIHDDSNAVSVAAMELMTVLSPHEQPRAGEPRSGPDGVRTRIHARVGCP